MIPRRLAIRNFMCYREVIPPLHFDGIHTACIAGDNGHGKSALIDAITWALWGKSRAKNDDELIYQNQTEMEVEFDFSIRGQTYRVIRKHSRPKLRGRSPQTSLDLLIDTGDGFRLISGNTKAETQRKIIDILHMDYETFINSAFLRQGNADEFTRKQPSKRKEVLASILRLSLYDELETHAKELAREKEAEGKSLELALENMSEEIAKKPTFEAELREAESELQRFGEELKRQELKLKELRGKREVLESKRSELAQLEEQITNIKRVKEQFEEVVRRHQSKVEGYEKLISNRATIEEGHARLSEAKSLVEALDAKLKEHSLLTKEKYELEMKITQMSQELSREQAVLKNKFNELKAKGEKLLQLEEELRGVRKELSLLEREEEALKERKKVEEKLRASVHQLEIDKRRFEEEVKEIEEKLKLLSTQTGARCPLCESKLGEEGLNLIKEKYGAEKEKKIKLISSIEGELAEKRASLESLGAELLGLEAELSKKKAEVQAKESLKGREIAEAKEAQAELSGLEDRLFQISTQLKEGQFAPLEKQRLAEVEGRLRELSYDSEEHDRARERFSRLSPYEELKRQLEEAQSLIGQEKEALLKAKEALEEQRALLETSNRKVEHLKEELSSFESVMEALAKAEGYYQELRLKREQVQQRVGSARSGLERCLELEVKKKESEKALDKIRREAGIYKELAQAFGKGGVQALIIERALPEIENEANELLSRMTDGRMHIQISPQRETKKGDAIETLDINISDELGTRSYELFSGGEAFRINFAIRIALSKLLARRAGAPLSTLIIDEGFGTQDSTGIEKLKEAINSIKDDFEKIFVITHIEELRDAFPTKINVTKTDSGSTIEIS